MAVEAYEKEPTHRELAKRSIELAITASGPRYDELKFNKYKDSLTDAAVAEDKAPRFMNHFYDPSTGLGLPQNYYTFFLGQPGQGPFPRIISALDWARDGMPAENGEQLDWKGAIEVYDYTPESKQRAYKALGHVLHLLHDMAQPDHARDRPHPCNVAGVLAHIKDRVGYETLWAQQPTWPNGTTPRKLATLEQAFTDLAYESKQAEDSLGLPIPGDELALGCRKPSAVAVETLKASGGLATESVGAIIYDANVLRLIVTRGWNSLYDSHWQETELAIPLTPTIPVPPGDFRTRAYLQLGRTMLPKAEEFGAGLLRFFYDIVNPPPFVEEVQIYQKRQRKYRKWWEDQKVGDRVANRQVKTEGDGVLESGVEATVYVWFGPRQESDLPGFERKHIVLYPTVTFVPEGRNPSEGNKVTLDPRGPEFGPNPEKGPFWIGTFTPNDGATLRIEATDANQHYKDPLGRREQSLTPVDGKRGTQGDLDSDPSTPARATWRESKAGDQAPAGAPYPWKDYEAGPDTNHHFTVKAPCEVLTAKGTESLFWGTWNGSAVIVHEELGTEYKYTGSFRALVSVTVSPNKELNPSGLYPIDFDRYPVIDLGRLRGRLVVHSINSINTVTRGLGGSGTLDLRQRGSLDHELRLGGSADESGAQMWTEVKGGNVCADGTWRGEGTVVTVAGRQQQSFNFTFTPSPPPPHVELHVKQATLLSGVNAGHKTWDSTTHIVVEVILRQLALAGKRDEFNRISKAYGSTLNPCVEPRTIWLSYAARYADRIEELTSLWMGLAPNKYGAWVSEQDDARLDALYAQGLQQLRALIDQWQQQKRSLEPLCATATEQLANVGQPFSADGAEKLRAMAATLRSKGIEGLVAPDGAKGR